MVVLIHFSEPQVSLVRNRNCPDFRVVEEMESEEQVFSRGKNGFKKVAAEVRMEV